MSRYAEYEALSAIGTAYERWTDANTQLEEQMGVAASEAAAPPTDALEGDFVAGLEVTRAVIAFARACPTGGPHLDDLPNAAFMQAMYQAVTPQLQDEIEALTRAGGSGCQWWGGGRRRARRCRRRGRRRRRTATYWRRSTRGGKPSRNRCASASLAC